MTPMLDRCAPAIPSLVLTLLLAAPLGAQSITATTGAVNATRDGVARTPPEITAGATVVNRELGFWDLNKRTLLVTVALLAGQFVFIGGLLVQRRRRRQSEGRTSAILRAMPDLMFLQTTDGVYVDYHASEPARLLLSPEQFLGRNMRAVLPAELLRTIEPAFAQAAATTEPVVVEYDLNLPHEVRRFEARLALSHDDRILTLVRDITERKRAEDALRESEAVLQASNREIQDLAGRLIASQEVDRARIARDLHDDLSQQLAGLSIALSAVKRRIGSFAPDAGELLGEVSSIQQRTVSLAEYVRRLSHDLHPSVLAHAGLVATLADYCKEIQRGQTVVVTLSTEGEFESSSAATALCLYRVAQEGLRNVVTHAGARHAEVRLLRRGDFAELTIADDGIGFDIAQRGKRGTGLGLVSIHERVKLVGGTASIVTESNKGTRLRIEVPATAPVLVPS